MQDDYYRNRRSVNSGGDTFFAFMTGLVLGGIAALLTSRDTREKVIQTLDNVKTKGQRMAADTAQKAQEATEILDETAQNVAGRAEEQAQKAEEKTNGNGRRQTRQ